MESTTVMTPPKPRVPHGSLKVAAEKLAVGEFEVTETVSQARLIQLYLRNLKRRGQVQVENGVVRVWRTK